MQVELILLVLSMLFFASIFTDKIGYKFGVPALLLFLAVGMLFGPDGIGRLINEDGVGYMLNVGSAQAIGTIALCIILFSGGMDTQFQEIRPIIGPGLVLATIGVVLTALILASFIALVAPWLGFEISFPMALLLAATMSSTDSASVFSILRSKKQGLREKLRPLLERFRPTVLIETGGENRPKIIALFRSLGYRGFTLEHGKEVPLSNESEKDIIWRAI